MLSILVVIACGAAYWHWTLTSDKSKTIEFIVAMIGAGTAIYALLLSVQGTRASAAAEFKKRWNSPDFEKYRVVVGEVLASNSVTGKDLEAIRAVLSFFEELSIATLRKDADEALLKDFLRTVAVRFFLATQPWIETRRAENHQPTLFAEYEKLYARWKPRPLVKQKG
jgi:hypothetical protein